MHKKLKRKLDPKQIVDITTIESLRQEWTQCCFLIKRKLRFCNVARSPNSLYCGNHQPSFNILTNTDEGNNSININQFDIHTNLLNSNHDLLSHDHTKKRIPCPIDPTHHIYESNLNHHLKICTKLKQNEDMEKEAYYCFNCNSFSNDNNTNNLIKCDNNTNTDKKLQHSKISFEDIDPNALMKKVNDCYNHIVMNRFDNYDDKLKTQEPHYDSNDGNNDNIKEINDIRFKDIASHITNVLGKKQTSHKKLKHVEQDVLIIKQMVNIGLISIPNYIDKNNNDTTTTTNDDDDKSFVKENDEKRNQKIQKDAKKSVEDIYIELGAGKGMLGYAISCVLPESCIYLVERSGNRKKIDRFVLEQKKENRISSQLIEQQHEKEKDIDLDKSNLKNVSKDDMKEDSFLSVQRIRMDIRHCNIAMLPNIQTSQLHSHLHLHQPTQQEHLDKNQNEYWEEKDNIERKQNITVVAKHLCGVATDLAIHSLKAFPHISANSFNNNNNPTSVTLQSENNQIDTEEYNTKNERKDISNMQQPQLGISIATCCHHACVYEDYVGQEWYHTQGFTRDEFEVLKAWSGWASSHSPTTQNNMQTTLTSLDSVETVELHNGNIEDQVNTKVIKPDSSTNKPVTKPSAVLSIALRPSNISVVDMAKLGWRVKRIFDQGRVEYINKYYPFLLKSAKQVTYCNRSLSPECVMIIATSQDTS